MLQCKLRLLYLRKNVEPNTKSWHKTDMHYPSWANIMSDVCICAYHFILTKYRHFIGCCVCCHVNADEQACWHSQISHVPFEDLRPRLPSLRTLGFEQSRYLPLLWTVIRTSICCSAHNEIWRSEDTPQGWFKASRRRLYRAIGVRSG